jgi:hypothetical protein
MKRKIIFLHASYLTLTGIWPFISLSTFLLVTGPKTDIWLVKMVGLLAAVVGATLLFSLYKKSYDSTIRFLGITSAVAFAVIDIYYVWQNVISIVYLFDAFIELAFITFYFVLYRK